MYKKFQEDFYVKCGCNGENCKINIAGACVVHSPFSPYNLLNTLVSVSP